MRGTLPRLDHAKAATMLTTILLSFLLSFIGCFAIHTATRALMGPRADTLPGGALVFSVAVIVAVPGAWWITAAPAVAGAAAGHLLSIWCWRNSRASRQEGK